MTMEKHTHTHTCKRKDRRNLTKGQVVPRKYNTRPIFGEDLIIVRSPPHIMQNKVVYKF
jgi:hypothetical protein